jgi:hypothetical protein
MAQLVITIRFFECYLFTVVHGLAVTLSPIVETLRRIEDYPQRRPSFRDLEERRPREQFAAPLEEHHDRTGIEFLCVSASLAADSKTATDYYDGRMDFGRLQPPRLWILPGVNL